MQLLDYRVLLRSPIHHGRLHGRPRRRADCGRPARSRLWSGSFRGSEPCSCPTPKTPLSWSPLHNLNGGLIAHQVEDGLGASTGWIATLTSSSPAVPALLRNASSISLWTGDHALRHRRKPNYLPPSPHRLRHGHHHGSERRVQRQQPAKPVVVRARAAATPGRRWARSAPPARATAQPACRRSAVWGSGSPAPHPAGAAAPRQPGNMSHQVFGCTITGHVFVSRGMVQYTPFHLAGCTGQALCRKWFRTRKGSDDDHSQQN